MYLYAIAVCVCLLSDLAVCVCVRVCVLGGTSLRFLHFSSLASFHLHFSLGLIVGCQLSSQPAP